MTRQRLASRLAMPLVIGALPVVLLVSSWQTYQEMEQQREVYLRVRAATLAGRLETLPAGQPESMVYEALEAEEPGLSDVRLIQRGGSNDSQALLGIWEGRQLFRTEMTGEGEKAVYRAFVPFHSAEGLRIARIDLAARSADFLMVHARHNVAIATLGGLVLIGLSLYAVWSARRAAQLQVKQLSMEHLAHLGKMSAVLAHEIRNPLGTIKGFAQLALESVPDSRQFIEPVVAESCRLEGLVKELLLYGRTPEPSRQRITSGELVQAIATHARYARDGSPLAFRSDVEPLAWEMDLGLLEQILLNLLRNAAEALTGPDAQVLLEIRHSAKNGLRIVLADNGPGLPPEASGRAFEEFFTTKPFGTGLGLPIARKLTEALDGNLSLEPRQPAGLAAVLRFPRTRVTKLEENDGINTHSR